VKRFSLLAAAVVLATSAVGTATAAAQPQTLTGSCSVSGPIEPNPPITIFPKPGAHFSYQGAGTCSGALDGAAVSAAATTLTFTNVATAFDTCELGPDFGLAGTMSLRAGDVTANFAITINLARLALVGPFALTTAGGGEALGTAQFTPPNEATAIQDCLGSGISTATLSASFSTLSPLIGSEAPAGSADRAQLAVRWTSHRRHHRGRAHTAGYGRRSPRERL
jgi:hypothetical protein